MLKAMKKKVFQLFMLAFCAACISQSLDGISIHVEAESVVSNPRIEGSSSAGGKKKVTWDCISFGNFYQSDDDEKEPIKWRVLSVKGNDAFILSDQIMSYRHFFNEEIDGEEREVIIWEHKGAREWLNDEFYNEAFDSNEKSQSIMPVVHSLM